jgi:hypothetical protein
MIFLKIFEKIEKYNDRLNPSDEQIMPCTSTCIDKKTSLTDYQRTPPPVHNNNVRREAC